MKIISIILTLIILTPLFAKSESLFLSLEDCTNIALQNNLKIKIEKNELLNTQAKINIEKAFFYNPDLNLKVNYQQEEIPKSVLEPTLPGATTKKPDYKASLNQKLPLGGELSFIYGYNKLRIDLSGANIPDIYRGDYTLTYTQRLLKNGIPAPLFEKIHLAKFDVSIKEKRLEIIKKNLIYEVKSMYYEVLRANRNIELNKLKLELTHDLLRDATEKVKRGLIIERDKLEIEMKVSKIEDGLLEQQNNFQQKKRLLMSIIGLEENKDVVFKEIQEDSMSSIRKEDVLLSIQNSSEIKEIEEAIKKVKLELKIAENEKMPELNFIATYTRKEEGKNFKDSQSFGNKDFSVGLQFSYPIGNLSAKERYLQKKRELENIVWTLESKKREILIEVEGFLEKREETKRKVGIAKKSLENFKHYLEVSKIAFEKGLIAWDKILLAEEDLLEAEIKYTNKHMDYYIEQAKVERIFGF